MVFNKIKDKTSDCLFTDQEEAQVKCQLCKEEVLLPFQCNYCGQYFCGDHRLPEKHLCPALPSRDWSTRKKLQTIRQTEKTQKPKVAGGRSNWEETSKRWAKTSSRARSRNFKYYLVGTLKFTGFLLFLGFLLLPNLVFYTYLITELDLQLSLNEYLLSLFGMSMVPIIDIARNISIVQLLILLIIPILILQKIRKKTNKWYYLIPFGLSIINWYFLIRIIFWSVMFQQLFSV